MLAQTIANLKTKLQEEKNFTATMSAFYDVQDRHPDFVDRSKPRKSKMLEKIVLAGASSAIGKPLRLGQFMALEHRETGLIHGFYSTKTGLGSFFFFNDIRMGMGVLQVGIVSHTFRITADMWDQEGRTVQGKVTDLPVEDDPE